jgi:DNA-binding response OmpR family regulator
MSGKILLVEDNEQIQASNRAILERSGYDVRLAMNLAEARKEFTLRRLDAIILDITLPDGNGLDFLRELRRVSQIPVLLLTAMNTPKDATAGLDAGSDDYLSKPYDNREFRARVDALMRRAARVPEIIEKGSFIFDMTAGLASLSEVDLQLSPKEFALLLLFVQNEEHCMSAEYLYEKVWKSPMAGDNNAIKGAIKRLRSKINGSGYCIAWSTGEGYSFERE